MATSGSVDHSTNRNQIIDAALANIGVLGEGDTASTEQIAFCAPFLNDIIKQWSGHADFAQGVKVWSRRRGTVFLQKGQGTYNLGPSGDHATDAYQRKSLTAAALATDLILTVDSISGISQGHYIGIELDSGFIHWTTVNAPPSGSSISIADQMPSLASIGRYVFSYEKKIMRPVQVENISLRDLSLNDTFLGDMSTLDYELLSDKHTDSVPSKYLYEFGLVNGTLFLDTEPTDVTSQLRIVYFRSIEDLDAASDEPDYPQGWYRALKFQLAMDVAPAYGRRVTEELRGNRDDSLIVARNQFPETTDVYFQPGID